MAAVSSLQKPRLENLMDKTPIPCFVCGEELDNIAEPNQPMGGTEFKTYGHYGSGVFDPMDGSRIIVNICNTCLLEGVHKQRVLRVPSTRDYVEIFQCQ